jgi:hypothetical protein
VTHEHEWRRCPTCDNGDLVCDCRTHESVEGTPLDEPGGGVRALLDEAWAAAEAAAPEWGWIRSLTRLKDRWEVVLAFSDRTAIVVAHGDTPAAALVALAAKLRGESAE